jgi:hypothetical protein
VHIKPAIDFITPHRQSITLAGYRSVPETTAALCILRGLLVIKIASLIAQRRNSVWANHSRTGDCNSTYRFIKDINAFLSSLFFASE